MPGVSHWQVVPAEAGQKLLQFLARRFARGVPTSALQRWIRTGQVRVDGSRAKPNTRLESGQVVRIPPHELNVKSAVLPFASELTVLHETDDILLLSKPAGLPVHPGSGHVDSISTRLKARYARCAWTPTVVHRLDRDTSGLLVAAKSYAMLRELHDLWRSRQVCKGYLAWVHGDTPWDAPARIEDLSAKTLIGKREQVVLGQGRKLVSLVRTLARRGQADLVLIVPLTGRTHQIRVQLAGQGHPLLGDRKYGRPAGLDCQARMMLHAWHLSWPGFTFSLLPSWSEPWNVNNVTDEKMLLEATQDLFQESNVASRRLD